MLKKFRHGQKKSHRCLGWVKVLLLCLGIILLLGGLISEDSAEEHKETTREYIWRTIPFQKDKVKVYTLHSITFQDITVTRYIAIQKITSEKFDEEDSIGNREIWIRYFEWAVVKQNGKIIQVNKLGGGEYRFGFEVDT